MEKILFIIPLLLFSSYSYAAGYSSERDLVKINADAARGNCLPELNRDPNNVLRQSGIEVFTARNRASVPGGSGCQSFSSLPNRQAISNPEDGRLKALAQVVQTLNTMGSGNLTTHHNIKVVMGSVRGPSRQCPDHVQLNPGSQNCMGLDDNSYDGTNNIALIAHELGHQVGNGGGFQSGYEAAVPSSCRLTTYAGSNRREEFAEVFAAYVTNPSIFQGKGQNCEKAFKFLTELFGETPENGTSINMTCESRLAALQSASAHQQSQRDAQQAAFRMLVKPSTPLHYPEHIRTRSSTSTYSTEGSSHDGSSSSESLN